MAKHRVKVFYHPMYAWWISYAGEEGWRGGIVIEACTFLGAVDIVNLTRQNPGGEVHGTRVALELMDQAIPKRLWGTLRNREEWELEGIDFLKTVDVI